MKASTFVTAAFPLLAWIYGCTSTRDSARVEGHLPAGLFAAICQELQAEDGFDQGLSATVFGQTRPIYEILALRSLKAGGAMEASTEALDNHLEEELRRNFRPQEVAAPPETGPCRWEVVKVLPERFLGSNKLLLELSGPIHNPLVPMAEARAGVFARFSLGGQAANWYWVSLSRVGGGWIIEEVVQLPVSDG